MKVLALVHKYPPVHNAGAEVMLHAMLVDLVRRGHTACVTYPGAQASALDGVDIVPTPPLDSAGLVQAARAADVLITHLDVTRRAMRVARAARRPLVHVVHNDRQLEHHAVSGAALIVFNSEWIAHNYRRWAGDTCIVRPPVLLEDYELGDFALRGDRITLVNLTQSKGARTFYELAAALPDRPFLGVRGAYGIQTSPRKIGPRRNLPNVELHPHVPAADMRLAVYARTRILLVPSNYESWGRVAIEAYAAGIPVIAHPTPGLLEALGDAGIFADRQQIGEWRRRILDLDDPARYAEASIAALARAEELDRIVRADLDAFALRLEGITAAYDHDETEESPVSILTAVKGTGGRSCPVCGARHCACTRIAGRTSGVNVERPVRRGLPLAVYRTAAGDFRLNEDDARRRGLIPDGPDLPRQVHRTLTRLGIDVDAHAAAYAAATDEARARYLTEVALRRPLALAADANHLRVELGRSPAPAAAVEGGLEDLIAPADLTPPGGRVGEVLAWAGDNPDRIRAALDAERARPTPRPTLVAELERNLEEA